MFLFYWNDIFLGGMAESVEEGVDACGGIFRGLCMENGKGLLFGDGEAAADKAPVFFGFTHPALFTDGERLDGIKEFVNEEEGGIEVVGLTVFYLERKERVV